MKAPKLLPWIARKAGIGDELALKLWRRAAGESEELVGCCDTADYYRLAMERFIDLVEAESEAHHVPQALEIPRIGWLWRHQNRMSQLGLLAARNTCRFWQTSWQNYLAAQKRAA
jgi:hypothetical protein